MDCGGEPWVALRGVCSVVDVFGVSSDANSDALGVDGVHRCEYVDETLEGGEDTRVGWWI